MLLGPGCDAGGRLVLICAPSEAPRLSGGTPASLIALGQGKGAGGGPKGPPGGAAHDVARGCEPAMRAAAWWIMCSLPASCLMVCRKDSSCTDAPGPLVRMSAIASAARRRPHSMSRRVLSSGGCWGAW